MCVMHACLLPALLAGWVCVFFMHAMPACLPWTDFTKAGVFWCLGQACIGDPGCVTAMMQVFCGACLVVGSACWQGR